MSNQEPSGVDPHNTEAINLLSSAVALLDKKSTLSEQDIRAKNEILKAIHRLTTPIPKMNPMKINELLSMILSKLKVQNLLHLRTVCSHWKAAIEAICSQKKCLKLFSIMNRSQMITLPNRFFGTIKLDQFVELKLRCVAVYTYTAINRIEESLCTFLGQIFPNVDQLIVDLNLEEDSITNFHNMLEKCWPNLNTLSLNNRYNDLGTFHINKLKRLDVGYLKVPPSPELIAQLEHFSCAYGCADIFTKMPQLGSNCTSFCWSFERSAPVAVLDQWIQHNSASVLANITKLELSPVEATGKSIIGVISENFPSLQVLSVRLSKMAQFRSTTCAQLGKLSHLTTLCFEFILFDLNSLESTELKTRLSSIRTLNLTHFGINGTVNPFSANFSDFDGDRFCRVFASVFPNIEKFGIFSSSENVLNKIRDNLNHFGKSLKFRIRRSADDSYCY